VTDRIDELEARIEALSEELARVRNRVGELEAERGVVLPEESAGAVASEEPEPSLPLPAYAPAELGRVAALSGRTFLILGGGYLLRALTDAGVLPDGFGVPLALAYAALWLVLARRAPRENFSAFAYGLSYALVAFPLLVEITTRFQLLSPTGGAASLGLASVLGLGLCWEKRLGLLAWALLVGCVIGALVLLLGTSAYFAVALVLVGVAIVIDWIAAHRGWRGLRAAAAFVADLAVLGLGLLALVQPEHRAPAIAIELVLFALYLGSYVAHTLLEHRSLGVFERVQASAVLVVGYLGAIVLAESVSPVMAFTLGAASVALGVASYVIAYVAFALRRPRRVDAWFYTSYALVGVLAGCWGLLGDPAYAWTALSLLLTIVGIRDQNASLPLHAAIAALFAALSSGLVTAVGYAFVASAKAEWPVLALPGLSAMVVAGAAYLAPLSSDATRKLMPARVGKTLALTLLVGGIGALVLGVLGQSIAAVASELADPGRLAALRTGVLAVAALALALLSRVERFEDAGLLVYPLLATGGLKLLLEDFPHGRPLTLFAAFLFYGIALLVAPRLRRVRAAA
jgi:hypothetical protein